MDVIVTGQHLEISDTLRGHVHQKISHVIGHHKERVADHHQADGVIKTLSEK